MRPGAGTRGRRPGAGCRTSSCSVGVATCHVSRVTCHVTVLCEQGWRRWRKPSTDKQRMGNSLIYLISSIMSVINIILEINFDRIC